MNFFWRQWQRNHNCKKEFRTGQNGKIWKFVPVIENFVSLVLVCVWVTMFVCLNLLCVNLSPKYLNGVFSKSPKFFSFWFPLMPCVCVRLDVRLCAFKKKRRRRSKKTRWTDWILLYSTHHHHIIVVWWPLKATTTFTTYYFVVNSILSFHLCFSLAHPSLFVSVIKKRNRKWREKCTILCFYT